MSMFFRAWPRACFTTRVFNPAVSFRWFSSSPEIQRFKADIEAAEKAGHSALLPYCMLANAHLTAQDLPNARASITKAQELAKASSEQSPELAEGYAVLRNLYSALGEFEQAISCAKKAAEIEMNLYGEYDIMVATSYTIVASLYYRINEIDNAYDWIMKGLPIIQEHEIDEHSATFYTSLGAISSAKQMKEQAIDAYQKAIVACNKAFGENSVHTARAYHSLGIIHAQFQEFDQSFDSCSKAIDLKVLPQEELIELEAQQGLNCLYLGKATEAVQHYKASLEEAKAIDNPFVARCHLNLARAHRAGGELALAQLNFETFLNLTVQTNGEISAQAAEAHDVLFNFYRELGYADKAIESASKSLAIRQSVKDTTPELLATSYTNLGVINQSMGKLPEAENYYRQALQAIEKSQFSNSAVAIKGPLCMVLIDMGKHAEAIKLGEEVVEATKTADAEQKQKLGFGYFILGSALEAAKKYPEAISAFEKGLEISQAAGDFASFLGILDKLGDTYKNSGNIDKAIEMHQQALETRKQQNNEFSVGQGFFRLAIDYIEKKDYSEAVNKFTECIQNFKAVLDGEHPYVARIYIHLAEAYKLKGDLGKCKETLSEAIVAFEKNEGSDSKVVNMLKLQRDALS